MCKSSTVKCSPQPLNHFSLDPSMYGSKRDSQARSDLSSRLSTASSDASFGCLHRTASARSNASVSTAASSTPSLKDNPRSKHIKTFSGSSISRRFLTKSRPQESQRQSEPAPTSAPAPVISPTPAVPPSPIAIPVSPPTADWQCSDLVVRCRNDVYHVDRVIMSYHSRWFAKVSAIILSPVS
jgi:hypothetical protein